MTQQISVGDAAAAVGEKHPCQCTRTTSWTHRCCHGPSLTREAGSAAHVGHADVWPQHIAGALIFRSNGSSAAINLLGAHAPAPRLLTTLHCSTSHPITKGKHPCSGDRLLNSQTSLKMGLTVWILPTTQKMSEMQTSANIQERKKISENSRNPEQSSLFLGISKVKRDH